MLDVLLPARCIKANMAANEIYIDGVKFPLDDISLNCNWENVAYNSIISHTIVNASADNVSLKKKDENGKDYSVKLPYKESFILESSLGNFSLSFYKKDYEAFSTQTKRFVIFNGTQEEFNKYAKSCLNYTILNLKFLEDVCFYDFDEMSETEIQYELEDKLYSAVNSGRNILIHAEDLNLEKYKSELKKFLYCTFLVN